MLQPYLIAGRVEAGCDEAGRGCLAGPVTAAAVILPPDFHNDLINDSKQLTERQREQLRPIIEREALAWAVAMVSPEEIDRINILRASITAMHRALDQLTVRPEGILVDGNRFFPYHDIPHTTDEFMRQLDNEYPQYGWARNKGYPTPDHRAAIAQHGASPYHRHTFQLLPQPTLFDL